MNNKSVDLSIYSTKNYAPGGIWKRVLWMLISSLFFETRFPFPSQLKCKILRLFGSNIGKRVVIKPQVKIKYPWFLSVGDYSWLGELVWIDNLVNVSIADNCCVSQGALLLTGNHNFKRPSFDLLTGEIIIKSGAWVGAKSVVCPGVTMNELSMVTVGSILSLDCRERGIYQGNPASFKKIREILE